MKEDLNITSNLNEEQLQEITGGCANCDRLASMARMYSASAQRNKNIATLLVANGKANAAEHYQNLAVSHQNMVDSYLEDLAKANH